LISDKGIVKDGALESPFGLLMKYAKKLLLSSRYRFIKTGYFLILGLKRNKLLASMIFSLFKGCWIWNYLNLEVLGVL